MNDLLRNFFIKRSFGRKERIRVWRKMATQLSNGIPLQESLRILRMQSEQSRSAAAAIFETMQAHNASGHKLAEGIIEYASPEEVMLLASGEVAGKLSASLRLAADLMIAKGKIVSAIVGALAYPALLSLVFGAVLLMVSVFVMPDLAVTSDPSQWSGMAGVLYVVTSFINSWGGVIAFTIAAFLPVAAVVSFPVWTGRYRLYVEKIPPWSIYRLMVGCVWLLTLGTLMRANVQMSRALENMISAENTPPYLRERVRAIAEQIRMGRNLGDAMFESGMGFPDRDIVDDMRVYSMLPGFDDKLYELALDFLNDGIERIQKSAKALNTVCMLLIISLVLCLALAVVGVNQQLLPQGGL
ncbi:MAG: type II secretion system F family protein [Desulfovibrio sp.]|jgi:type II secretory pathway component PulF|nr:type II secretion system F family protein [Desulfovibrio sp.]